MSCEVYKNCLSAGNSCWQCRFSEENIEQNGLLLSHYNPIDKNIKHPILLREKEDRKKKEKLDKKQKVIDKNKSKIVRAAAKTEDKVRKTLNSGRINKDGDLVTEDLGIDVKLQTTRKNPIIDVNEFDKCQNDARRAGKQYGVLIIENKDGRRFCVLGEELFSSKFI